MHYMPEHLMIFPLFQHCLDALNLFGGVFYSISQLLLFGK